MTEIEEQLVKALELQQEQFLTQYKDLQAQLNKLAEELNRITNNVSNGTLQNKNRTDYQNNIRHNTDSICNNCKHAMFRHVPGKEHAQFQCLISGHNIIATACNQYDE
jgi:fructose-1,6-bisphosphatase